MNTSIMIVGVGGQGTLLASRILGSLALLINKDVKVSEVHGMSQRGGSVVTYVKIGDEIYSPLIDKGEADYILAFEKLEAYRALPYLKEKGKLLVNDEEIQPISVITGGATYPENILEKLGNLVDVKSINALDLAIQAGSNKATNVVMLGLLAKEFDIEKEIWLQAIKNTVKEKFLEMNIKAFELGYNN